MVATCDYAGRSYGWEPLSGQSERPGSAQFKTVCDLGRSFCVVCAERLGTWTNETRERRSHLLRAWLAAGLAAVAGPGTTLALPHRGIANVRCQRCTRARHMGTRPAPAARSQAPEVRRGNRGSPQS